jgi:preprotein translocase subunit Sec61beta
VIDGPDADRPRSETFRRARIPVLTMSGSQSGGLMSSAGLVRYFDAEDRNAIRIDPKTVVAFGVLFGVLVQILNVVSL